MTAGETASGDVGDAEAADATAADSDPFSFDRDRDEYAALVDDDRDEPVVARAAATLDLDTSPLAAYAALADRSEYNFLLESAEKVASSDPDGAFTAATDAERHARYSFVGYDPEAVISVYPTRTEVDRLGDAGDLVVDAYRGDAATDGDVLDRLRRGLLSLDQRGFPHSDRRTLSGGLVGFLAHEAVYDLVLEEVGRERPATDVPDAQFALTTRTLVFDDAEGTVELVFTPIIGPDDDPGDCYDDLVAEAADVAATLTDADEPEPTGFRRTGETAGSQADYEDAVRTAKRHVLDGDIYQGVISRRRPRPCPRGSSPVEDRRLAGEMLADGKERAEHTMLVDLARNDVRRVAAPGSVEVEEFMSVLKYSHVQHIESTVTARVADEYDAFDAARATFPAGTLTGAPKVRAMEIIDELEPSPRGPYCGAIGYLGFDGVMDTNIAIRTAVAHGGRLEYRAGGGLVWDSNWEAEYEETRAKAHVFRRLLGGD